jgi:hypothetical protein
MLDQVEAQGFILPQGLAYGIHFRSARDSYWCAAIRPVNGDLGRVVTTILGVALLFLDYGAGRFLKSNPYK